MQLKNPKMVCMNLTLAMDGSAEKPDPTPQTVMFSIGNADKAGKFCTIVEKASPK